MNNPIKSIGTIGSLLFIAVILITATYSAKSKAVNVPYEKVSNYSFQQSKQACLLSSK